MDTQGLAAVKMLHRGLGELLGKAAATPADKMEAYGNTPIFLKGVGRYGWGTMQRLGTAYHVTSDFGLVDLEARFGTCSPHPNMDWHGFGDTMPEASGPMPVEGDKLTCVGFVANTSAVPEVRHFEYCKPDARTPRAHLLHKGRRALSGGMSGGAVYRGHIGLADLSSAESIGYIRAEASIWDADGDGKWDEAPFWGLVSFWHDLTDPSA